MPSVSWKWYVAVAITSIVAVAVAKRVPVVKDYL